jgi:hypothetical protein
MPSQAVKLTAQQRRMYAMEKVMNFRSVYRLLAKCSQKILDEAHLASIGLFTPTRLEACLMPLNRT